MSSIPTRPSRTHPSRRFVVRIGLFAFLWLVLWGLGMAVHQACDPLPRNGLGFVSVAGFDGEGWLHYAKDLRCIVSTNYRHPLQWPLLAPVLLLAEAAGRWGGVAGRETVIIGGFSAVGALGLYLMWMVLGRIAPDPRRRLTAMAVWLSFAYVWLVSCLTDSFVLSQTCILASMAMLLSGVRHRLAWGGLVLVTGGVTSTNAVKPLVAWLTAENRLTDRRWLLRCLGGLVLAGGLVLLAILVKFRLFRGVPMDEQFRVIVTDICQWFPQGFSLGDRMRSFVNAFLCEPLMLHGEVLGMSWVQGGYGQALPYLLSAAVYGLSVWGAVRGWQRPWTKAVVIMVSFDFVLHGLLGWGLAEGQIYAPHWFWCLPLFLTQLPRPMTLPLILLAATILSWNLNILL